jgi:P2-related tail formation protein
LPKAPIRAVREIITELTMYAAVTAYWAVGPGALAAVVGGMTDLASSRQ